MVELGQRKYSTELGNVNAFVGITLLSCRLYPVAENREEMSPVGTKFALKVDCGAPYQGTATFPNNQTERFFVSIWPDGNVTLSAGGMRHIAVSVKQVAIAGARKKYAHDYRPTNRNKYK